MDDVNDLLAALGTAVAERRTPGPATLDALGRLEDPMTMQAAGRILKGLSVDDGGLRPVRVAVQATFTAGPFEQLLRAALVGAGALPAIEVGAYASFDLSLATNAYAGDGDPDVLACLLADGYLLPAGWSAGDPAALVAHLDARVAELRDLVLASAERTTATIALHTVPMPAELRDGLISWRGRSAVAAAWHRMNAALLDLAADHAQVVVIDLAGLLADLPAASRDDRLYRYADMPYTVRVLALLAQQVRRVVQARQGLSRKVLALDLDNTLWGGVVGEVGAGGIELGGLYPGNCYAGLQRTAARLREQGVLLALASKNDPDLAERTLAEHPEVLLRPAAFSARAVNWEPKADNLRRMAATLGLPTGSFVFVDDSAFECGHVRAELPEVAVVAAGGDPAHPARSLLRHGWFDVLELTGTDRERPDLYRARAQRIEHSAGFASTTDYLHALAIEVTGSPVTEYTAPRAAQLAARTNQFNLTGVRYDEATTAAMAADPGRLVATFTVADRFGDEGIVGAAWVTVTESEWRVENVVLSCRVLGRGIEFAVLEWIARRAQAAGAPVLAARFVSTDRNGAADGFLEKAGLAPTAEPGWRSLGLTDRPDTFPTWIRLRDHR